MERLEEDRGWLTDKGEFISNEIPDSPGDYEEHSHIAQDHGFKDQYDAIQHGWIRYGTSISWFDKEKKELEYAFFETNGLTTDNIKKIESYIKSTAFIGDKGYWSGVPPLIEIVDLQNHVVRAKTKAVLVYGLDKAIQLYNRKRAWESIDKTLSEKLVSKDYTAYAKMVSDAYLARPDYESQYTSSWHSLAEHTEKMFQQVSSKIKIEFVDEDPYASFDEMKKDIETNHRMKVWTGESSHPIFTTEQNLKFRAVHDYMVHIAGDHPFTLRGELSAYNRHLKTIPKDARLALFTEVVGQVCVKVVTGSFASQKICKLWGFDYVNVGQVDDQEYQKNFPQKQESKMNKRVDSILSEVALQTDDIHAIEGLLSDSELARAIRLDLEAEMDAINLYTKHLEAANNPEAQEVLEHVIQEEKEHASLFMELLKKLDPAQAEEHEEE
jgi:hypothetical protein